MFYISKKEFNNLKPLDGINDGEFARCYKYNNDVLKVYKTIKYYKLRKDELIKNIKILKKNEIEGISFPIDVGLTYHNRLAYTMPFLEGDNFSEIKQNIENNKYDITLEEILYCYHDAIEKVEKLNSLNFRIFDLHLDNCKILKDSKFGLLDVDFYTKTKEKYHDNVCEYNIKKVNEVFLDLLNKFYSFAFLYDQEIYKSYTYGDDKKDCIDEVIKTIKNKTNEKSLKKILIYCDKKNNS